MMSEVDLHLHTNYSDGRLTPTQIVDLCANNGLRVISITDHDSTEGIPEAIKATSKYTQLTLIPGIELSTDVPSSEIHILGYYVNYQNAEFQTILQEFRGGREKRVREMVDKLNDLGILISWDRVKELSDGGALGRPHIAQAMVEAGYIEYPRDAFDKYIGRNGPAYAERSKMTPVDAIRLLVDNGALPVLAHPTYTIPTFDKNKINYLKVTLWNLKMEGLVGMEVYYGDYTIDQVKCLRSIADEIGLIPCGGSDYHASGNPGEPTPGSAGPSMDFLYKLKRLKFDSKERPNDMDIS